LMALLDMYVSPTPSASMLEPPTSTLPRLAHATAPKAQTQLANSVFDPAAIERSLRSPTTPL
jgi:hypothetical protein